MKRASHSSPATNAAPLDAFAGSHAAILSALDDFADLPHLAAAARRCRNVAVAMLALFDGPVAGHHADEERDLFQAVLRSASAGEEHDRVECMVGRMAAEHRAIEALWKSIRPAVKQAAEGACAEVRITDVAALVQAYGRHASYEETEFLPLAQDILGRDASQPVADLHGSLESRHATQPVRYA